MVWGTRSTTLEQGYQLTFTSDVRCLCKKLGVHKLNLPPSVRWDVEQFNRTLKTALCKRAATFGCLWNHFLSGVLVAYRNVPHDSTGEKPSYLLFGLDYQMPSEAAYLKLSLFNLQIYKIIVKN